jgi:molybdenum cofactor cytidylyltransferase
VSIAIDSRFGLAEALRVGKGDVVSLVGAGGKTTILYGLSTELRRLGLTVVTTTTTHIQSPDSDSAYTTPPVVFASEEGNWIDTVRTRVERYGAATVVGTKVREDKLKGLAPREVDLLRRIADCLVIEADGARSRSLKAPASHEPVVPPSTTLTVAIAGLDALGQLLDEKAVHRPEEVVRLTGASAGSPISEEVMTLALYRGYEKSAPASSRLVFFLNKADESRLKQAERVARLLLSVGASQVVFGEARNPHGCFYTVSPERAPA